MESRNPDSIPSPESSHDAGLIDRARNHWGHAPPLDGGNGDDDDADTGTDTAIPDDDDDHDIVSLAS